MAISLFASFRTYVFSSILLTTAVLSHAIYTKRFFYRSVVHLANSKFAILAVANMALVTVLLIWRLIQAVFLGPLRFRETERLHIRARDAIIECCFAISVFREEFNYKFVALVMTLLLLKSLHWLTKDRIEFLEEQPLAPRRTHVRLVGLMLLLAFLDSVLVTQCVGLTLAAERRTMFVLFAFEFTLLQIELLADTFKYIFLLIDTRMDNRWDSKSLYTFYSELICDMCQLTVYIVFFFYVQMHYGFPYHIIRELYMTFHKFRRRCADFLRYRRVVATMNDLFADATEEELSQGDRTCIICREEMNAAKKLSCGHMFHARCLQSWLKRQLSCPTCRATIDVSGNPQRNAQQDQQGQQNQQNQPRNQNAQQQQQPQQQPQPQQAQQGQQPVNLGDAGQRLLNFANEWWNQVMNDAGMQGQNPRMQPFLRGPNAIAHRQLRQRRRGAWPGPYQPFNQPGANHNPFAPVGQQQQQQQPPQARVQQPADASRRPSQAQEANGGASSSTQVRNSAGQSSSAQSSSAQPSSSTAPRSLTAESSNEGQQSSATQATTSQPSSGPQQGSSSTGPSQPTISQTVPPLPPLPTLFPSGTADLNRLNPVYSYIGRGYRGFPGTSAETAMGQASNTQTHDMQQPGTHTFPLDRLLAIQEQIEILRSEVQTLVLLATNPPPADPAPAEAPTSTAGPSGDAAVANSSTDHPRNEDATSTEPDVTDDQTQAQAAEQAPRAAQDGNEDNSEAARLRRRRIEFLERRPTAR